MTTRKPLVYIAGPYTHPDPVENTHRAIRAGLALYDTGLCGVIIPHVTLAAHLVDPRPVDYWYRFDLDQLVHCDALLRLPGDSSGADKEVAFAQEHGIPVYLSRRHLVRALRGQDVPALRAQITDDTACPDDPDGQHYPGCGCDTSEVYG